MSDELLDYYRRELAFIRKTGDEFAQANPGIAARLKWGPDDSKDPHVERLVEAFALLTARVRRKLDDDFPELTDAVLGTLYPHYLAPTPSMAIVQFSLEPSQKELVAGYNIPAWKGFKDPREAAIETEEGKNDHPCRFNTVYPVRLWPIAVSQAVIQHKPLPAPPDPSRKEPTESLRLTLKCLAPDVTFAKMNIGTLRFFLKGQEQHTLGLYEMLFNHTTDIALIPKPGAAPIFLPETALQPGGFGAEEGILPHSPRVLPGYRILEEYFAFPKKFLFVEIRGLTPEVLATTGNTIELVFNLNRSWPDIENNISADTFRLGCAPIINLFKKKAEPIDLTHDASEYHIIPSANRPTSFEIYSIESVVATSNKGEVVSYEEFYASRHSLAAAKRKAFWYANRRPAQRIGNRVDPGTEMYLSLVDLKFNPAAIPDWTIDVETLCLNRDLPHALPYGGGHPTMQLVEGGPIKIEALSEPTPTLRPDLKRAAFWRLVSNLSLNHLSLTDSMEAGPEALREILRLHNFAHAPDADARIAGILGIQNKRVGARVRSGGGAGFVKGVELEVTFDEDQYSDNGLFLFASVLERFFALYASVNSFSKMVALTKKGTKKGELRRWPARSGEIVLL
jgi:type VI secretion system protein ImpG